jgi:hypothetical protein
MIKSALILLCVILLMSCTSGKPTSTSPANTHWKEVVEAKTTVTFRRDINLPFVSYDTGSDTLTINDNFSTAIIWHSDNKNFLNFVTWSGLSTGAMMGRIDLSNKKGIYLIGLIGLGPLDHSQYRNSIRVFENKEFVQIFGTETFGTYSEVRNLNDGKLVNISQNYGVHELFPARGLEVK